MPQKLPRLSLLAGLAIGLSPLMAAAQVVQPFLPVPTPPAGPQAPTVTVLPPRGSTVESRPRPEIDALGTRLGSYWLYPRIELDETYNDNIFAAARGTSDLITTVAPSFDLLSNFGRHALNFHTGAAFGMFASHSSEDYKDAFASTDGRFDIDQGQNVHGSVQVQRLHESRYSPDSPGAAAEPVKYMNYGGALGYEQTGLRIGYSADATLNRYDYESVPAIGGGRIFQSDRNMTTPTLALRGSYEFEQGLSAYIRGEGNYRKYDHGANAVNPIRDSAGYRADVGIHADLTGVTVADAYVGYLEQFYRMPVYSTLKGVDVGAKVTWNFSTLDTLRFSVDRTVQDLNSGVLGPGITSPGYLDTVVAINEDHELLRDLLLNANASYTNDDFQGIKRVDHDYAVGVGAKYLMNRYLYVGLAYTHAHRTSTGAQAANNYSDNLIMLRLSSQL
jgi:hypothetical protein